MPLNLRTDKSWLIRPNMRFIWQATRVVCGRHGFLSATAAPAGRPARARPQGRAQRAGSTGGQASQTTESTTSAPPEAALLDPIEDNSATHTV